MGTVYAQPDHRFCRRWAVLTDPEETLGASGAGVKVFIVLTYVIKIVGEGVFIEEVKWSQEAEDLNEYST